MKARLDRIARYHHVRRLRRERGGDIFAHSNGS